MCNLSYSAESRDKAVHQIIERGQAVIEEVVGLGIPASSLNKWLDTLQPVAFSLIDGELIGTNRENLFLVGFDSQRT